MTEHKRDAQRKLALKGTVSCSVAGISFDGRQAITHALARAVRDNKRAWVEVRRERNNDHDPNAVAIIAHTMSLHARVGYVPARIAADLAAIIDDGGRVRADSFAFVGGYGGRNIGMRLELEVFA